jgi:hypothetical protein
MRKRRVCLTLLLLCFAFVATGSFSCGTARETPEPTTPGTTGVIHIGYGRIYENLSDLVVDADLIAAGEITRNIEVVPDEATRGGIKDTISAFRIETILKGKAQGEVVVSQEGAIGFAEEVGNPVFRPGEKCVLFLKKREEGRFSLLNGPRARYVITDGKVSSMNYVLRDTTDSLIPLGLMFWRIDLGRFTTMVTGTLSPTINPNSPH